MIRSLTGIRRDRYTWPYCDMRLDIQTLRTLINIIFPPFQCPSWSESLLVFTHVVVAEDVWVCSTTMHIYATNISDITADQPIPLIAVPHNYHTHPTLCIFPLYINLSLSCRGRRKIILQGESKLNNTTENSTLDYDTAGVQWGRGAWVRTPPPQVQLQETIKFFRKIFLCESVMELCFCIIGLQT